MTAFDPTIVSWLTILGQSLYSVTGSLKDFVHVTKSEVEWIISCLAKYDIFWTQTNDALGKPFISPVVKFLAAQKTLCYGVSFSSYQDYFQMRESTACLYVSNLSRGALSTVLKLLMSIFKI